MTKPRPTDREPRRTPWERFAAASPIVALLGLMPMLGVWRLLPGMAIDAEWWLLGVLVVVVAALALPLTLRRPRAPGMKSDAYSEAVGVGLVLGPLLFLAAHAVNRFADGKPAAVERVEVLAVHPGRGSGITVAYRGGEVAFGTLGNTVSVGDRVTLRVHGGALGWAWTDTPRPQ